MADPLVQALRALCGETREGRQKVADAIGSSEQTIYQIVAGVKLPSGNPKGVGPTLRKRLDEAFPGWLDVTLPAQGTDTPSPDGEAQPLSLDAITVDPELPWEAVTTTRPLPPTFRLAAPDDALAPAIPRGTMLMMARYEGEPLEPQDGVLVRTAGGHVYLRMYAQGPGTTWTAKPHAQQVDGYLSLDSVRDGLVVLAVMTGQIRMGRKVR